MLDVIAIHPFTNKTIPIFVSKTATFPEGADVYMGKEKDLLKSAL